MSEESSLEQSYRTLQRIKPNNARTVLHTPHPELCSTYEIGAEISYDCVQIEVK